MFRKMLLERFDSNSSILEHLVVLGAFFVMRIDDFIMGSISLLCPRHLKNQLNPSYST
jgi:hypothetical protein